MKINPLEYTEMYGCLAVARPKNLRKSIITDIDPGIKILITIILVIASFLCKTQIGFIMILMYVLILTLISRIDFYFFIGSLVSYTIIVLLPYLLGFLFSMFFSSFGPDSLLSQDSRPATIIIKLARIFLLWHIGSLFLYTTSIQSVVCLLNKIFKPLKFLGIPVTRLMSVIMCIMSGLPEAINEFHMIISRQFPIMKKNKLSFKANIKAISDTIVDLIIHSLQKTGEIQAKIEEIHRKGFAAYSFQIKKREIIAVISCLALIIAVLFIEKLGL